MHKLKFNGKFEHGSNSCEMCQNNHFYFDIQWIAWWDYSKNLSFIWTFYLKAKTWNILGFINSWHVYIWHIITIFLGESVCISLRYCGECMRYSCISLGDCKHDRGHLVSGKQLKNCSDADVDVLADTSFIAACCGSPSFDNMTTLRYQVWFNKM